MVRAAAKIVDFWRNLSASNRGSDSISMKFPGGVALSSERNQHHASTLSVFLSHPQRIGRRKHHADGGGDRRDCAGRYPGGNVPSVSLPVAARSQPLCSAGLGSALLGPERMSSCRGSSVLLRGAALPETDF